jgi:hypothetical protein
MVKNKDLEGKIIEFTGNDILKNLHYVDLEDYGIFFADKLEIDYIYERTDKEGNNFFIIGFTAYGKRVFENDKGKIEELNEIINIETVRLYNLTLDDINNMSAGRIFHLGWGWWTI